MTQRLSFDGKQAYEYLDHLAVTIGPRLTGSDGEHAAARYIRKVFNSFGLKTSFQKYPSITYANHKCVFEVRENGQWKAMRVSPVMLTPSTPPAGLTGDIFFAETGDPQFFSPAMKGKIVLVLGGIAAENRRRFLSHGPASLIMIEEGIKQRPRCALLDEDNTSSYGNLPMGIIRHLDGLSIIKSGLTRARFTMINTRNDSYSLNVIGEKVGTDFPDEIVVVCGHYDSHMDISGATDNAAGTAIVMELARVLAASPSRRTLRFVAFSGEETGLHGSTYYANQLARQDKALKKKATFNKDVDKTPNDQHRLSFNIDVHGAYLGRYLVMYSGVEDVGASARLLTREIGMACRFEGRPMSSDGTPLAAVGIPAVQFGRYGGTTSFGHSDMDEIQYLSADVLAESGLFVQKYLQRYVTDISTFPFPREIPDDHAKAIRTYFERSKRQVPGDDKKKK